MSAVVTTRERIPCPGEDTQCTGVGRSASFVYDRGFACPTKCYGGNSSPYVVVDVVGCSRMIVWIVVDFC